MLGGFLGFDAGHLDEDAVLALAGDQRLGGAHGIEAFFDDDDRLLDLLLGDRHLVAVLGFAFGWMRRVNDEPPMMSMPPLRRSLTGVAASDAEGGQTPISSTVPTLRFLRSISVAKYQKNRIIRVNPVRNTVSGSSKNEVAASMAGIGKAVGSEGDLQESAAYLAAVSFLWTVAIGGLVELDHGALGDLDDHGVVLDVVDDAVDAGAGDHLVAGLQARRCGRPVPCAGFCCGRMSRK